jgi:hypothetical protein
MIPNPPGCVSIARPYALNRTAPNSITLQIIGRSDLQVYANQNENEPFRYDSKSTANAVGSNRPSGVQIPDPPQLPGPAPDTRGRGLFLGLPRVAASSDRAPGRRRADDSP